MGPSRHDSMYRSNGLDKHLLLRLLHDRRLRWCEGISNSLVCRAIDCCLHLLRISQRHAVGEIGGCHRSSMEPPAWLYRLHGDGLDIRHRELVVGSPPVSSHWWPQQSQRRRRQHMRRGIGGEQGNPSQGFFDNPFLPESGVNRVYQYRAGALADPFAGTS